MRKVEEELAWFDKYFFKTAPPENESVKAGSPLDTALRSRRRTHGRTFTGRFSRSRGNGLIPEVVKRDDLEIARFEVTAPIFRLRKG